MTGLSFPSRNSDRGAAWSFDHLAERPARHAGMVADSRGQACLAMFGDPLQRRMTRLLPAASFSPPH